jgi:hypothetical protein
VVVNCAETPTAEFTRNPDWQFPLARMQAAIGEAVGSDAAHFVDASDLATAPARRRDRQQPVPARLRLAAGPGAGDRRQRSIAPSNSTARRWR